MEGEPQKRGKRGSYSSQTLFGTSSSSSNTSGGNSIPSTALRVQEAAAKNPILRALAVPQCDMAARRRCIELLCRVLDTALLAMKTLDLFGGEESKASAKGQKGGSTNYYSSGTFNGVSKFWLNHYRSDGGISARTLIVKIRTVRDALVELGDKPQGAVSYVFWVFWDEVYVQLCQAVGIEELQRADSGRLFRPTGEAALFIDIQHATKRRRTSTSSRASNTATTTTGCAKNEPLSMISGVQSIGTPLTSGLYHVASGTSNFVHMSQTQMSPISISTTESSESPDSLEMFASDNVHKPPIDYPLDLQDTTFDVDLTYNLYNDTPATSIATNITSPSPPTDDTKLSPSKSSSVLSLQSGPADLSPKPMLNLRQRIQLMEAGLSLDKDRLVAELPHQGIEW